MEPIRLVVHGAAGRMGRRIIALAASDPTWKIQAALESSTHSELGKDAGLIAGWGPLGVSLTGELRADVSADVAIDFSAPAATVHFAEVCKRRAIPLVCATTGLTPDQKKCLKEAAEVVPVLWAPNMSLAVNLAMKLVAEAARILKNHHPDIEIVEWHHRFKEDAPSGTALQFAQIIEEQLGKKQHRHGREGRPGIRSRDEIGFHAIRAADHPGEHVILFGLLGETLELNVRAISRDCYAQGALAAARFLVGKPPGLYSMAQVLGL